MISWQALLPVPPYKLIPDQIELFQVSTYLRETKLLNLEYSKSLPWPFIFLQELIQ